MNTYIINSKIRLIKQARDDFKSIYGLDYTPFTRKQFFYHFFYDNKKYVHKESLNFVYTNGDTYTKTQSPDHCKLVKEITPPSVIEFLESYRGSLIPKLLEANSKFLVYEYTDGPHIDSIDFEEFYYLKSQYETMSLTPFYNSMAYNIVRSSKGLKLIDLKHFEPKDFKPFFIYLYNQDNRVNTLYVERDTKLEPIVSHLAIDYPIKDATIIEY